MKKISVIVPCYNEEHSLTNLKQRVENVFSNELSGYDYEIIFVDDASKDNTEDIIRNICADNNKCKAVFNAGNFGFHRNVFESFKYATGDAAFMMFGDMQDPPEMLPQFVAKWEEGYKCVVGQRISSQEKGLMKLFRGMYYDLIDMLSQTKQIHNMNGYGLYDRQFIDILSDIKDVSPYFKTVIAEYGIDVYVLPYAQNKSMRGKSNFNFWRNYDFAMGGITSSTKMLMRIATFVGVFVAVVSLIFGIYVFIRKLIYWDSYPFGIASVLDAVLLLGSLQLIFIGILGEYILSINERTSSKPRVVVKEKINFDQGEYENIKEK